ncbi:MAG: hypothetical protein ACOX9C_12855 [Kiritimatiellia bacterium]
MKITAKGDCSSPLKPSATIEVENDGRYALTTTGVGIEFEIQGDSTHVKFSRVAKRALFQGERYAAVDSLSNKPLLLMKKSLLGTGFFAFAPDFKNWSKLPDFISPSVPRSGFKMKRLNLLFGNCSTATCSDDPEFKLLNILVFCVTWVRFARELG